MSGMDGHMLSLLDRRHATGCDGQEFSTVEAVPYGDGFAVIYAEWCIECGAADWDLMDTMRPEGP